MDSDEAELFFIESLEACVFMLKSYYKGTVRKPKPQVRGGSSKTTAADR